MKKIIFSTIILFISISTFSQEKFEYNQNGLVPKSIVKEVANFEQNALYLKTLNWIKTTYKNPNDVIKSTIENEMIRIEGVKIDWQCIKSLGTTICSNAIYSIQFNFKNGKYRIEIISLKSFSKNGSFDINLDSGSIYYDKNGELKKFTKDTPNAVSDLFNKLITELDEYIKGENLKKEEW
jgi:hypothetical protein